MSSRDEMIERLKASLDEWNAEIDALSARARQAGERTRTRHAEDIETLKRRRDEAQQRLEELQVSSEAAWGSLRQGTEVAWARMQRAFKEAASHFK